MTLAASVSGRQVVIKIGDGGSPEVFSAVVALTTKGVENTTATGSSPVLDATDPINNPPFLVRSGGAVSQRITGSGTLAIVDFSKWNIWSLSGKAKNCQIQLNDNLLGYWSSSYFLSSFRLTGQYDNICTVDLTLESAGAITYTANI